MSSHSPASLSPTPQWALPPPTAASSSPCSSSSCDPSSSGSLVTPFNCCSQCSLPSSGNSCAPMYSALTNSPPFPSTLSHRMAHLPPNASSSLFSHSSVSFSFKPLYPTLIPPFHHLLPLFVKVLWLLAHLFLIEAAYDVSFHLNLSILHPHHHFIFSHLCFEKLLLSCRLNQIYKLNLLVLQQLLPLLLFPHLLPIQSRISCSLLSPS